ncbi:MAG: GNAT family N-acetyltransferase [Geodermatophilaceae bacterium]|jgi:RimJ/RimL family protein N-acetyltransferase|nr:GNAT family N-acetyltransferase [Geodermatophilaceae bacterium]
MTSLELIQTARLFLEPLRTEHAGEMLDVLSDDRLYRFIGGQPPTYAELVDQYTRQVVGHSADCSERWLNWIVREAETQAATGYVQATVDSEPAVAAVAWVIGTRHQGRGYATEAATAMVAWLRADGVGRVMADVHPEHHASNAVARRLGLAPTGEIVDGELRWAYDA